MSERETRVLKIFQLKRATFWEGSSALLGIILLVGLTVVKPGSGHPREIAPEGSAFDVRVGYSLSSETVTVGEVIDGKVLSSRMSEGRAVVPAGICVKLRCVAVRKAEVPRRPGYLRLTVTALQDSAGNFQPVETSTYSEWGAGTGGNSLSVRSGALGTGLQGPAMSDPERVPSSQVGEAAITPDSRLPFVLLKAAVMDGPLSRR